MTDDTLRTTTGAEILEVFWFDEGRRSAGLLVQDSRGNTWAGEWSLRDFPAETIADLRSEAEVTIEDGTAYWRATP